MRGVKHKMNLDKKSLQTRDLLNALSETKNIDDFLQNHEAELSHIELHTYLYELMMKEGYTIPQLIEKASIAKSLAYQIFNGQRLPNRNLLIRIAIALKLSLEDTQRLLIISKKGELYPRVQRDAAIIFCIQHGYSLIDTNELLENLGEAILLKED
jgi:transcriptional regulator with XRE-family HTH domain